MVKVFKKKTKEQNTEILMQVTWISDVCAKYGKSEVDNVP